MAVAFVVISGIAFVLAIVLLAIAKIQRPKGFPSGPLSFPIIGNLLHIGWEEPWKSFVEMGHNYGGIFTIDYGSYRSIVVDDLKLLKQCLNEPSLAGRPRFPVFLERTNPGGTYSRGILTSELQHWSEQRRFVLKNLRDFGFGKTSMEGLIQDELQEFLRRMRKRTGVPVKTLGLFNAAVVNSFWRICTGSRVSQNDPKLAKLIAALIDGFSAASPLVFFFPKLIKWFPALVGYNDVLVTNKILCEFMTDEYKAHKASFVPGQPRDLLDVMIEEVTATTDPESSFYKDEGEATVIITLEDLFAAGSETTSTTLTWICLHMALFPDVQEKMAEEISKVIGPTKMPELSDRKKMPYTECVIMEVLRSVAVFPLGVMHSATADTTIAGYLIPKDTVFTPNLYKVLHDPAIWGDPEIFRPERFLDSNGRANKSHEAFIPFSYGRRVCIGEKLAKDELFLFTTGVFQNFRVTTNPKAPKPSLKPKPTIVLSPKPHELIFHERA